MRLDDLLRRRHRLAEKVRRLQRRLVAIERKIKRNYDGQYERSKTRLKQ